MTGASIFTVGLLATIAHFVAAPSKRRGLMWFGLFAGPYGMALIFRSVLSPLEGSQPETVLVIFSKLVGLLAAIPALLLFQEWYGNSWHVTSRLLIAVYATAMVLVLGLMAFNDRPRSVPSPGILLVILLPLFLLFDHMAGYLPPPAPHRGIVFGGLFVFFITFSYDHLAHWLFGNEVAMTEPIGFLVLTLCFGSVVAKQVATNESERIAMEDEMAAARKIQARILPAIVPSVPGLSIAVRYSPMTAVAGDFYAFFEAGSPRVGITLADVMGHGVPAALVASMVKVSVTSSVERNADPPAVLRELNTTLYREAPGEYATAVYISIDHDAGSGKYSSAGHPPPLLWRSATRLLSKLNGDGLLLGVREGEEYTANEFAFHRGDRLLVYSDGLTEAENEAGTCFGDAQLASLIRIKEELSTEDFATTLLEAVHGWCQKGDTPSQSDDITFVVVDFR
jgi:sigma-B regulation protein RsbU (phosphoserine phosphatase)